MSAPALEPLPVYVDTRRVFVNQQSVLGSLAPHKLERLSEMLANNAGEIEAELSFLTNASGLRLIRGSVKAKLHVNCQRCLDTVEISVCDDINLALVADESAAALLEADLDPWIEEGYKLPLADLIEEQLILGMPIVSYHGQGDCQGKMGYQSRLEMAEEVTERPLQESPFGVLKKLKESDSRD